MKVMKYCLKTACLSVITLLASSCADRISDNPDRQESESGRWQLVWQDKFDSPDVDKSTWKRIARGGSDWSSNMSTSDAVFDKRDSTIVLKGIVRPDSIRDNQLYLTGGIETRGLKKFEPPFRVEVRCRMTSAQGAWPAIWMMPFSETPSWPDGGEIDIMEHLNFDRSVFQSIHSTYFDTERNDNPPHSAIVSVDTSKWNVYGLEINEDAVVWFINGTETFRYPRLKPEVDGQFPFFVPQFLLIDMQIGGAWVGAVNASDLPVELEVDWVKYYQKK